MCTVIPEGICSALFVFGAIPKLPLPGTLPSEVPQAEKIMMMMMETAREEYMKILGQLHFETAGEAFISKMPP